MKKIMAIFRKTFLHIPVILTLLLTACSHLDSLSSKVPDGTSFNDVLAQQYYDFANAEAHQFDWYDSEYFAAKGARAAAGEEVLPENPADWRVKDDEEWANLLGGHTRIANLLFGKAKGMYPQEVAKAQVLFDCWVEQAEEGWQQEDIEACRGAFGEQAAMIEEKLVAGSEPPVQDRPIPVFRNFTLFFDFDKSIIKEDNKPILEKVVAFLSEASNYSLTIEGHADRAGEQSYNQALSERRAEVVKKYLAEKGINVESIKLEAYGETKPQLPTKDGIPEPLNRRVEIKANGFEKLIVEGQ